MLHAQILAVTQGLPQECNCQSFEIIGKFVRASKILDKDHRNPFFLKGAKGKRWTPRIKSAFSNFRAQSIAFLQISAHLPHYKQHTLAAYMTSIQRCKYRSHQQRSNQNRKEMVSYEIVSMLKARICLKLWSKASQSTVTSDALVNSEGR